MRRCGWKKDAKNFSGWRGSSLRLRAGYGAGAVSSTISRDSPTFVVLVPKPISAIVSRKGMAAFCRDSNPLPMFLTSRLTTLKCEEAVTFCDLENPTNAPRESNPL
jgi:hypothetical protein